MANFPGHLATNWDVPLKNYIDQGDKDSQAVAGKLRPGETWATITSGPSEHGTIEIYGQPYGMSQARSAVLGCLGAGNTWLNGDLRYDADGTLWCYHQPRLEYTDVTPSTIDIENPGMTFLHTHQVAALSLSPAKITGGSYKPEPLMRFEDLIDEFGIQVPIVMEPKNQSQAEWWERSLQLIAPMLVKKNMQDRVAIACAPEDLATFKIPLIKQYGIRYWSTYADATYCNNDTFINTIEAANNTADDSECVVVQLSASVDDAHLARWKSICRCVVGDFYARRSGTATGAGTRAKWEARGVTMWTGNHAAYVAGLNQPILQDTWRYGYWGMADIMADGKTRPTLKTDGLLFNQPGTGNNSQFMLAGDFAELPARFQLDMVLEWGTVAASRFGVLICCPTDKTYDYGTPSSGTGYFCFRYNNGSTGPVQINNYPGDGIAHAGASGNTGIANPAGTTERFRVVVTDTTITASLVDAAGATIGTPAVFTDTQYRGGYLHVGGLLGGSGGTAKIKSLTITPTA